VSAAVVSAVDEATVLSSLEDVVVVLLPQPESAVQIAIEAARTSANFFFIIIHLSLFDILFNHFNMLTHYHIKVKVYS
jgi:hypothetical protein